ncbi:thymidine kinase [Rhizosaccharibacter radicis]|uniref:Thymidine kinase n=1 Tax=Rhizosaccharibacter radicis TaxID=2782605 RepID=A0ABT1VTQ1_9PROT|nr:thymidine kinase [Acetobacteraceae bacterium KSS12]
MTLIAGPMFAGKSHALIRHSTRLGRAALLVKPGFDTRDGAAVVASRAGASAAALPVSRWPVLPPGVGTVLIDEVQFLTAPHYEGDLPADVSAALAAGVDVIAGGLDTDYLRRPFAVVEALAAMADRREMLHARCHRCEAPARWTAKKNETGRRLELGDADLYEARCDRHWSAPDRSEDPAGMPVPATVPAS